LGGPGRGLVKSRECRTSPNPGRSGRLLRYLARSSIRCSCAIPNLTVILPRHHSVGHWEGDTLVTDVSNFTSDTWLDRSGDFHSDTLDVVERYTPITRDAFRYEATIEDKNVFTRPWKIGMPIYGLEPNTQLMEFPCREMAKETLLGHLRRNQLIKQWEGRTMRVEITRKVPPGNGVYERHFSGNPTSTELAEQPPTRK
jgi:hypothetical protein